MRLGATLDDVPGKLVKLSLSLENLGGRQG